MKNRRTTSQDPMLAKSPDGSSLRTPVVGSKPRRKRGAPREPAIFLEEIRGQLGEGNYRDAQELAREAAARFPDHQGVCRMHRALNERAVRSRPATGRDTAEEFSWLKKPPDSSRGKWVALIGEDVVAASPSVKELLERLASQQLSASPLVVRVD